MYELRDVLVQEGRGGVDEVRRDGEDFELRHTAHDGLETPGIETGLTRVVLIGEGDESRGYSVDERGRLFTVDVVGVVPSVRSEGLESDCVRVEDVGEERKVVGRSEGEFEPFEKGEASGERL